MVDEIRTIPVLPAPWDLPFLHARQALAARASTWLRDEEDDVLTPC